MLINVACPKAEPIVFSLLSGENTIDKTFAIVVCPAIASATADVLSERNERAVSKETPQ
jgi:hypothetical protein